MTSKKMSLDTILSVTCYCVEFFSSEQFQEGKRDNSYIYTMEMLNVKIKMLNGRSDNCHSMNDLKDTLFENADIFSVHANLV